MLICQTGSSQNQSDNEDISIQQTYHTVAEH
jgi:hypothetical protein